MNMSGSTTRPTAVTTNASSVESVNVNRKKITSRAENKRIDHKKARAAERQVLDGGYSRTVHGMNWGTSVPQPSILDDGQPGSRPRKKNKRKWCKGQVGKEHKWVAATKYYGSTPYAITRCERCRKQVWGRVESVPNDPWASLGSSAINHWSSVNIWRRLAGKYCLCEKCDAEVKALFE